MFVFFCGVFLMSAIAATIWIVARPRRNDYDIDAKYVAKTVAISGFALSAVLLTLSSLTIVEANHVGVVTQFGSWAGTRDSGISWVAPWSDVDSFTTRNNKSIRDQADGNDPCVSVKFKGNASGCMDLTVLYTIDKTHAEVLWRGWGGFDRINSDLVNRATDNAVNLVVSQYAPEDVPQKRSEITDAISTQLNNSIASQGVHLESVTLGDMHLPQDVQDRINRILAQDANTRVAVGQEAQATAEAKAAAARQASLTPETLIKLCLDAAKEIKPQYFDCGLGGSTNKPSVILGSK